MMLNRKCDVKAFAWFKVSVVLVSKCIKFGRLDYFVGVQDFLKIP